MTRTTPSRWLPQDPMAQASSLIKKVFGAL